MPALDLSCIPMIRVILVADHPFVRDGVRRLLEEAADVRVVGTFEDATGAVRLLARQAVDVALINVAAGGESGIELARRMRAVSPRTKIFMLSMDAREDVIAALRALHAGGHYVGGRVAPGALESLAPDPLERLSAREMEVLKLVVEGNTSAEVAARLGLSPKSIDTYRSRLMTKLEVPHLTGLVKFAIRRGLTSA